VECFLLIKGVQATTKKVTGSIGVHTVLCAFLFFFFNFCTVAKRVVY